MADPRKDEIRIIVGWRRAKWNLFQNEKDKHNKNSQERVRYSREKKRGQVRAQ